ncbi:hypothetical protein AB7M32_000753 [Pseudomonas sp. R151218B TE3479]
MERELAPARLRSSRKTGPCGPPGETQGPASQASGSKLPRHVGFVWSRNWSSTKVPVEVYISVAAVTAAGGYALTACHFWQTPGMPAQPKVTKRSLPHHSAPRLGSVCPHSGIAPWARREGPSVAQRGYPGIHAGMPTAQYLRSASVVNGAPRSKARRGGLIADLALWPSPRSNCGSGLAREGGLIASLSLAVVPDPIVGASLLAMASAQPASM